MSGVRSNYRVYPCENIGCSSCEESLAKIDTRLNQVFDSFPF